MTDDVQELRTQVALVVQSVATLTEVVKQDRANYTVRIAALEESIDRRFRENRDAADKRFTGIENTHKAMIGIIAAAVITQVLRSAGIG